MAMSRSFGATLFTTRPPMAISPAVMFSSPAIMRSSVDLPQPEGPTRMTNSPSSISTLTPCRTSVEPNDLRTFRMETVAMMFLGYPPHRHGRGLPGHPRLIVSNRPPKAWMAGISPAMTGDEWRHSGRHKQLELRDPCLLGSDELQQRWLALLRLLNAALDRRLDLCRIRHPLAVAAERLGHVGVVARDVGGPVLLG